uniref:Uncharacterized protein n=1 Tax=Knipowitschia caucasica TaxID=637954 RepID=A0AAV2K245_KNICA
MRAGLRAGSRVGHPRSTQRAGEERHIRDLELTARGSRVCGFVLASGVCGAGGPGQQQQEDEGDARVVPHRRTRLTRGRSGQKARHGGGGALRR